MAETQETHAAVIAEMRTHDPRVSPNLPWDNSQVCEHDDYFADRLEAAHERELEAARREPRTWEECVERARKEWEENGDVY